MSQNQRPMGSSLEMMKGLLGSLHGVGSSFGEFEAQLEIATGSVLQILLTVPSMETAGKDRGIQKHHQD